MFLSSSLLVEPRLRTGHMASRRNGKKLWDLGQSPISWVCDLSWNPVADVSRSSVSSLMRAGRAEAPVVRNKAQPQLLHPHSSLQHYHHQESSDKVKFINSLQQGRTLPREPWASQEGGRRTGNKAAPLDFLPTRCGDCNRVSRRSLRQEGRSRAGDVISKPIPERKEGSSSLYSVVWSLEKH